MTSMPESLEAYTVEMKAVELLIHVPQPLFDTLARMAQFRHCSLETLVVRLMADNTTVQKYFTREALALWAQE